MYLFSSIFKIYRVFKLEKDIQIFNNTFKILGWNSKIDAFKNLIAFCFIPDK